MTASLETAPKHAFAPEILRKYDIRGRVGTNLTEQDAYYIGLAYATYASQRDLSGSVCIGYDGRHSSPALAEQLASGLIDGGLEVIQLGLVATPVLYFGSHYIEGAIGGIMITGSHNPPEDNGFKMVLGGGPLADEAILELGQLTAHGKCELNPGGSRQQYPIIATYIDVIISATNALNARKLKIAWDPGNGAAGAVLPALLAKLPGEHILINGAVDGTFPAHHPDPSVAANLAQLQQVVREQACDAGFAFDGDGDRLGVVDDKGNIIGGDHLLMLFAHDLLRRIPRSKIIADVKTSDTVFEKIREWGGIAIMWKTGHSFIKNKMVAEKAIMAGEMSGHFFFAEKYYGFDDAIFAALKMLNIISRAPEPLHRMMYELPVMINTPEIRIDCEEARKFVIVDELKVLLDQRRLHYLDLDGVRVMTDKGWWLLRPSNTQSCLVMRAEAGNTENLDVMLAEARVLLAECGVLVPGG